MTTIQDIFKDKLDMLEAARGRSGIDYRHSRDRY